MARELASLVVLVHVAFVLFVLLGSLFVLRWPRVAWLHVPAFVWGVLVELTPLSCPLTRLENRLRVAGGLRDYGGGFVERYVVPVLYPAGLTRPIEIALGIFVLVLNVAAYAALLRRRTVR